MMTQEEFMNLKALRAAGWTVAQIARHLGYHPATISLSVAMRKSPLVAR